MALIFYILFAVIFVGCSILLFINNFYWKKDLSKVAKILSVVLVIMFFINIFLPDLFAIRGLPASRTGVVNGKADYNLGPAQEWIDIFSSTLGRNGEILHTFARVGLAIAPVSIPFAIFFKKKNIARVVTFVVLPFVILNVVLYFQYIQMFTFNDPNFLLNDQMNQFGNAARELLQNGLLRTLWFGIGLLITGLLSVYVLVSNINEIFKFDGASDVLMFVVILIGFVFTNMPIYTAQHLFHTYSNMILTLGYSGHFVFIGAIVVELIALWLIMRKRSWEDKYILMFIMAISLLIQYNTFFKTDGIIRASRWPLQLCNIAGAFIIVTLLTRSEKMYHFTLVVNTLGAVIAIAICDSTFNTGILYEMNIHYMVEHVNVLLVPVLCGMLGVFKPIKVKDVKHVLIGFLIYWAAILVIGTLLCSLQNASINTEAGEMKGFFDGVNYLFMFDAARSAELVGFAKPLFDVKLNLGNFGFTLAQPVILAAFEVLCVGFFFIFYACFKEKRAK